MLSKKITYNDLEGNEVTDTFYFRLNKADLMEMEISKDGGMTAYLNAIVASRNGDEIMQMFKKIIGLAVGRKSLDGKQFIKDEEARNALFFSEAWTVLLEELISDADAAAKFMQALIPAEVLAQASETDRVKLQAATKQIEKTADISEWPAKNLESMSREELLELAKRNSAD